MFSQVMRSANSAEFADQAEQDGTSNVRQDPGRRTRFLGMSSSSKVRKSAAILSETISTFVVQDSEREKGLGKAGSKGTV